MFFSVSNVSWHFLLWSVKVGVVYLCKLSLISKFQEEIKKHSATSQEYGNSSKVGVVSLLQHPSSPPVRKEYHQRFGRRWIYVIGDSGAITAGSKTVGDVHPSPPVRIWNHW